MTYGNIQQSVVKQRAFFGLTPTAISVQTKHTWYDVVSTVFVQRNSLPRHIVDGTQGGP